MMKCYLNSMFNNWILITHKCRFITWRCGSYFCCMCFTTFSDSTSRGGNIFYRVNLESGRRLSFLVLSELMRSEIGILRNLSPAVSLAFFVVIDIYIYICIYCCLFWLLYSPPFCHTQFVSQVNKQSDQFQQLQDTFYVFKAAERAVITCAYVREADDSDNAYFNFSLHLLLVEMLVSGTGHCYWL
jgi:hypothetical protein